MVNLFEVNQPRLWIKPVSKVYDVNRISGEFYYKPMVEYIDNKEDSGLEFHPTDVLERKSVYLPSALEASKADISCLSSGCPKFVPFLAQYGARQMKEKNKLTAHVKYEFARKSKKSETIAQKRTSVMIRDQYIASVDTMYKEQMRRKKYMEKEEEEKNNKVCYNQGNLKYVFSKH
eukprot:TRINITY_DN5655_c0_g1_i1.p1 TRINITY_DN5655_c0_g1~~TRINITY_DN5655_c0_g1_i1.p1  ORF type:complete len:176 (-),score=67.15 TRINITY_DN5655_c0_g1_i1:93-620(-)